MKTRRPRWFPTGAFYLLDAERLDATSLPAPYISIPPIPPIPPGAPPPCACSSSFGASAIMTSVVSSRPATEAAFCSAKRVTPAGSRMPSSTCRRIHRCPRCTECALACLHGVQDHRGIFGRILDDLARRLFDRAALDANADRLDFVRTFELSKVGVAVDQELKVGRDVGPGRRHRPRRGDHTCIGAGRSMAMVDPALFLAPSSASKQKIE